MTRCASYTTKALITALLAITLACAITAREPIQPNCLQSCESSGCKRWVLIEFDITPSGHVEHPEIVRACPDNSFNYTALEMIKQWRYAPTPEGKKDSQVILRK